MVWEVGTTVLTLLEQIKCNCARHVLMAILTFVFGIILHTLLVLFHHQQAGQDCRLSEVRHGSDVHVQTCPSRDWSLFNAILTEFNNVRDQVLHRDDL